MMIIELGIFSNRLKTILEESEWNSEEVLNWYSIFLGLDGTRKQIAILNTREPYSALY